MWFPSQKKKIAVDDRRMLQAFLHTEDEIIQLHTIGIYTFNSMTFVLWLIFKNKPQRPTLPQQGDAGIPCEHPLESQLLHFLLMCLEIGRRWPMFLGPCFHMGDLEGVLGSWLEPGLNLATGPIWGVNQLMENVCVCMYLSLCNCLSN